MKWAYYNDNDPKCCAWIRQLITDGLITDGEVDCRSITDVRADDVRGFRRVHFFAGIGGWDYALRLADWPDDRPVWTASCPCQPFSGAGLQMGADDPRHLFPALRKLVARCNPPTVIGEQVASALGRKWLARVRVEMATLGYAVTASDLCAAGIGAPQLRQRLYWMADASCERPLSSAQAGIYSGKKGAGSRHVELVGHGDISRLGHTDLPRPQGRIIERNSASERAPWATSMGVPGDDGTTRRVEPGIPPLAYGLPSRVALIRGSGNAIVPQLAAAFIRACAGNDDSGRVSDMLTISD